MERLQQEDLKSLLRKPEGTAVSIYLPTHRTGDTQADPLTLRHLLDEAESGLVSRGMRSPEARTFLEPARALLRDALFWAQHEDGLALFLAPGVFRYFKLPVMVAEAVVVADDYFIRPLLPVLNGDGAFYLLALSINHVRFYLCRAVGCLEVVPPKMPRNMDEALQFDDNEKQQQFHTAGPGRGTEGRAKSDSGHFNQPGRAAIVSHGQGGAKDIEEDKVLRFCQAVERGLDEVLRDEKAPLVIASVNELQPVFRKVSHYANIFPQGLDGNPDRLTASELQRLAWQVVGPYFRQEQDQTLDHIRNHNGMGPALSDPAQVIAAAVDGRIHALFVADGFELKGSFDQTEHRVKIENEPAADAADLIEFLIRQTLVSGGSVYGLKSDEMPTPTGVAALARY